MQKKIKKFYFYKLNITNRRLISDLFYKYKFYKVFHMAAQPGVRYSFEEPYKYIESNLVGFLIFYKTAKDLMSKSLYLQVQAACMGQKKKYLTLKIIQRQNQFNFMLQQNYLMKF